MSADASCQQAWFYVLFNEAAKQPVVLPFRGAGPSVILVWSDPERVGGFLRSLRADMKKLWRAYEWTAEDIHVWIRRHGGLAGVEMNPGEWPCREGALIDREQCESLVHETEPCFTLRRAQDGARAAPRHPASGREKKS